MQNFKSVGIVGFVDNPQIKDTVIRLARFLINTGITTFLEQSIVDENSLVTINRASQISRDEMGKVCDLIIVIGGDGSLLYAARDMVDFGVPMLGVNRGRLGFLTEVSPNELEQRVADVLVGNYVSSDRFMLEAEVHRKGDVVDQGIALNDVILQPSGKISLISFKLHIDNQFVYNQRADGLIVSTPTGSTAYSLSGGGSIVHPNLEAINLVSINPHNLSSRPILVSSDSELNVTIDESNRVDVLVVCDGQDYLNVQPGDEIRIRRKEITLKLLHPIEHDFYATCRTKLNWARD